MSHHSSYDKDISEIFSKSKLYQKLANLGATKQFPDGKLTEHDEGEIKFVVITVNNTVVIEFGQPIYWLGMTGKEAVDLGRVLLKHGRELY